MKRPKVVNFFKSCKNQLQAVFRTSSFICHQSVQTILPLVLKYCNFIISSFVICAIMLRLIFN